MKNKSSIFTYLSTLVIGVLLLVFHNNGNIYNTLVIVVGALIALPSLILILSELFKGKGKMPESAAAAGAKWITVIAALASFVFGLWMIFNPAIFLHAMVYTIGGILVLVGIAQICYIYSGARPYRPQALWFIVPVLSLIAGIIVILLGPDKVASIATLIAGIVLVVYAANGFAAMGREAKLQHDVASGSKPHEGSSDALELKRAEAEDHKKSEKREEETEKESPKEENVEDSEK